MRPVIRESVEADIAEIQEIYACHVRTGLASFEETPPDVDEMRARRQTVLDRGLPYLVAELGGRVIGYSYASSYRARPAYRYTLENTVYVADSFGGRGVGSALLEALIARCEAGPWRQMIAVIGDSANHGSIRLHRRCGFREIGLLDGVGYKLGRWVDSVMMQRPLGPGSTAAPDGAA